MKLKVKKLSEDAVLPSYAHDGDAGLDLYSAEDHILKPGEKKNFRTGVAMAIPKGHVGLIWDKSGHAAKNGVHVLAGVVDAGYRGEVGVVLKNLGDEDFTISQKMKIAQMLIQPVVSSEILETDSLDETSRNHGGFGSTGDR